MEYPDPLNELEDLQPMVSSKTGKPTQRRITSVNAARSMFNQWVQEDSQRSRDRARIAAMFDGAPPQNPSLLRSLNRGGEINVNMGTARKALDEATSGYIDLINSLQVLVAVESKIPDVAERDRANARMAHNATIAMRKWVGLHSTYLRLVEKFLQDGVGFILFPDPKDFRWKAHGWDSVFMPQQTPASPESLNSFAIRDKIPVEELYAKIENEAAAERMGWDVAAVKRCLLRATSDSTNSSNFGPAEWEAFQSKIKNGDLFSEKQFAHVPIVWMVNKEPSGKFSMYCFPQGDMASTDSGYNKRAKEDFLMSQPDKFGSLSEILIPVTYGVGNGTYHSIRGLGQRIFPLVQAYNRMYNTALNGAMLASGVMLKVPDPRSRANLQWQQVGPYQLMPENVEIEQLALPNLSTSVLPLIQDLDRQVGDNMDFYSTNRAASGNPYRNRLAVEAEIAAATRLTMANLSLFYEAWNPLMREMFRRLVFGDKRDPIVADFHRRNEEDGIPKEYYALIDFDRVRAVRSIGGGSASSRVAALGRLWQYAQQFDPTGRQNLLYDTVAAETNFEAAERYVSPTPEPRPTVGRKIAEIENHHLLSGQPMSVFENEMHPEHLFAHLPRLQEVTMEIDQGQVDAMQVLRGLKALFDHSSEHLNYLSTDPFSQALVAEATAILQRANEQILNYTRRVQAEAQQSAQDGVAAEAQDMEREQERNFQLTMQQLKVREAELKMAQGEQAHRQKMEQLDAKEALSVATKTAGF